MCVRVCIYYIYRIFFRFFCEETCIFYFKTTNASKYIVQHMYSICELDSPRTLNWSNLLKAIELQMKSLSTGGWES